MDKIDQQIIEAVNSVVNPDTTDTDRLVLEYLEGYFGDELNESTSDDDIMEAFNELLETADAVEEFMIQEGPMAMLKKMGRVAKKAVTSKPVRKVGRGAKKVAGVLGRELRDAIVAKGEMSQQAANITKPKSESMGESATEIAQQAIDVAHMAIGTGAAAYGAHRGMKFLRNKLRKRGTGNERPAARTQPRGFAALDRIKAAHIKANALAAGKSRRQQTQAKRLRAILPR